MGINEKLLSVQAKLKAPKSQYNSFGKYNYRNAEDILEAVKPLLLEEGLTLTITDDIALIGNRYYIKATVVLMYEDESISTVAFAREDEEMKGMALSQITGSSSSYARKYALNGLFLIDDTKDSDFTNQHEKEVKALSEAQIKRLYAIGNAAGYDFKKINELINKKYNKEIKNLTKDEYSYICNSLEKNK